MGRRDQCSTVDPYAIETTTMTDASWNDDSSRNNNNKAAVMSTIKFVANKFLSDTQCEPNEPIFCGE